MRVLDAKQHPRAFDRPDLTDVVKEMRQLIDWVERVTIVRPPNAEAIWNDPVRRQLALRLLAKKEYRRRRARSAVFGEFRLDREPAWDILVDIFATAGRGALHVTSACIASMAPTTTALRYIQLLEDADLISSELCRQDGRVRKVRLTDKGYTCLERYFSMDCQN